MNALPFVAIELKNTHHVLGVLSRDADSDGGSDIALLAPESLTVRAPRVFTSGTVPVDPPVEMQLPASQLQAVVVKNSTIAQRRQVFSDPLSCVVSEDGSAAPIPAGTDVPTLTLNPGTNVVPTFDLDIKSNAGEDGLAFTVVIQEVAPPPDKPPFRCITAGKVAKNTHVANGVDITLMPGDQPALCPIPRGVQVFIMIAVAGRALDLSMDPNP